jgi:hypothetical protein
MSYSRDWTDVGAVTLVTAFNKDKNSYPSIRDAIRALGVDFVNTVANCRAERYTYRCKVPYAGTFDTPDYRGRTVCYYGDVFRERGDHYHRGAHYILVDEYGFVIPAGVIASYLSSYKEEKKDRWARWNYDPDKDFRNGPLRGHSTRRWRCHGYSCKQKRGYHASLQNDEMIDIDTDLDEYRDMIRIDKTDPSHNPWDDERSTRRGNNWKRYRRFQWKEKG